MTEPARPGLTRRTFLIDRDFQLKYAGLLAFAGLLISLTFAVMTYLSHADAQRRAALLTGAPAQPMDPVTLVMLAVAVLIAASAMGLLGLVLTHRIAGPVYVMTHYVTALSKNAFPPIRPLRRNDELKHFFERFQAAMQSLKSREAEEAQTLMEALSVLQRGPQSVELQDVTAKLSALLDRKRAAVNSPATPVGSA